MVCLRGRLWLPSPTVPNDRPMLERRLQPAGDRMLSMRRKGEYVHGCYPQSTTPIWKLEPSFRCRFCGTRRYKQPVHMIPRRAPVTGKGDHQAGIFRRRHSRKRAGRKAARLAYRSLGQESCRDRAPLGRRFMSGGRLRSVKERTVERQGRSPRS